MSRRSLKSVRVITSHSFSPPPTQLVSAYLELSETVKRMERHAELREELLRRSQRQLENRDRTIKEKDNVIRKMERIDEEPEDLSFPGTSGMYITERRLDGHVLLSWRLVHPYRKKLP